MTVEIWYGRKPEHESEQDILAKLYQYLLVQDEHFVVLVNFYAGQSNEIDLAVLKEKGVFLAEIKHVGGKLIGCREGSWKVVEADGKEISLPGRNPFKQVKYNYWKFKEWCEGNTAQISAGLVREQPIDFNKICSFIVIHPNLHPQSTLDIGDHPVRAIGLESGFVPMLHIHTNEGLNISRQEMQRLPHLLGLSRWLAPSLSETVWLNGNYQPSPFVLLVARGHGLSAPLFRLDMLGKDLVSVGRDPDNDLIINHPAVSRHHAEIERRDARFLVRDLSSSNGTFVSYNGDPTQERNIGTLENALKDGSMVRFGPARYNLLFSL